MLPTASQPQQAQAPQPLTSRLQTPPGLQFSFSPQTFTGPTSRSGPLAGSMAQGSGFRVAAGHEHPNH